LIDAVSRKKVRDVPIAGTQEAGQVTILFGPDGKLYAAETGRNAVAEIDLGTGKVLRRLPAGTNGDGLAIAPAQSGN
jgi:DNA-binding beta-propeller fold protein YncE